MNISRRWASRLAAVAVGVGIVGLIIRAVQAAPEHPHPQEDSGGTRAPEGKRRGLLARMMGRLPARVKVAGAVGALRGGGRKAARITRDKLKGALATPR